MKPVILMLALAAPAAALAHEKRAVGAHEHGQSALDIAIEGNRVAMVLRAPGFDIVGFEYEAATAEDRAALDAGIAALSAPLSLFVVPQAAGCSAVLVRAGLVEEHDHDHAEAGHDHAEADHDHDGHDHAEDAAHAEEEAHAEHTEFQARYTLDCADPSAIDRIEFAFFERFPNAQEVDVQLITDKGATGLEVTRAAPVLDLAGRI